MVQSKMDLFLFIVDKLMAINYVDYILFWYEDVNEIYEKAIKLSEQGVDLEHKDDAAGFMGVT